MRNRMLHGHFLLAAALAAVAGACGDSPAARDITGPDINTPMRAPASLEAVTPTDLTGTVGVRIDGAPTVRVKDATGSPVSGVGVTFVTRSLNGSASVPVFVTTGADGTAMFSPWILSTRAGSQTLVASVQGVSSVVVFTADAGPGPAAKIIRYGGTNHVGDAGAAVGRMTAQVVDAFGNPVKGVGVLFAVTAGGGTIDSSPSTSDANGLARSGEWILGAAGLHAVEASSPGLTSETFSAVALPPEAERMTYVLELFDGRPAAGGTQVLVLTSVIPVGPRQDGPMFFAGVIGNLSWGHYTISNGKIRLDIVAGDWFAWADNPLFGWHTQEEIGLTVWMDGPAYDAHFIYRRKP